MRYEITRLCELDREIGVCYNQQRNEAVAIEALVGDTD